MKNVIKEYESPVLFVISIAHMDVIRTSNPGGGGFGGEEEEFSLQ